MRNRNPEIVDMLKEKPMSFQCKKCGQKWVPAVMPNGRFARGAWQCPSGCRPDIAQLPRGTRVLLEGFIRDLADIQADPSLSDRTDDKMTAIKCRLAIKEMEEKLTELGSRGIVDSLAAAESEEWLSIERETSPLKRLERRVGYTRRLLERVEEDLKWIRKKWGL